MAIAAAAAAPPLQCLEWPTLLFPPIEPPITTPGADGVSAVGKLLLQEELLNAGDSNGAYVQVSLIYR